MMREQDFPKVQISLVQSLTETVASSSAECLEYTVAQLARAIQASLEKTFGLIRLRGEVSSFKKHTSGHAYFALKDQDAVIDAVCWRGTLSRASFALADGMEIIAVGRITSYPQRSRYQMVIESFELTGEGTLLKILEDLKKRLKDEGLFDLARKKPLPFLPRRVGIITSPTGAVIQDMLHRLRERVPCHVMIWPVAVQGQGSVDTIVAALEGFHTFPPEQRPDVIIVARGGGSLEDLWGFNDERMVRAVAASVIPIISAVGHETDTTLVDYAADHRAPTPTAAAEVVLPLKRALLDSLRETAYRMHRDIQRLIERHDLKIQRFQGILKAHRHMTQLPRQRLDDLWEQCVLAMQRYLQAQVQGVAQKRALLESYAYHRVLERGFCFVENAQGHPITSAHTVQDRTSGVVHFHDGQVPALLKPSVAGRAQKRSQEPQTQLWSI